MSDDRLSGRLGERLIERGLISEDQLHIALLEQRDSGQRLGKVLVDMGFTEEGLLREALGEIFNQHSIELAGAIIDPEALKLVTKPLAERYKLLPLHVDAEAGQLHLAMADPLDLIAIDRIRSQLPSGMEIVTALAGERELMAAVDRFYGYELSVNGILQEIESGAEGDSRLLIEGAEYSHPIVRLVDAILVDAVKRNASDIHFEPESGFVRIRYRIDGVLRQVRSLHRNFWSAMAVRLKVIAGMNIAETRAPQDGHISQMISGAPIDFRVSTVRTLHGENIVLRVLNRNSGIVVLDRLGLSDTNLAALRRVMCRPEGMVLITGPTGSGKTTTLYSMLSAINSDAINIMTLEDPVEYPLEKLRQVSVGESSKIGFADGIRALLRQDPDVILVGEIRDRETAEMALRAAMTGHQVYATLHTNSALGAFPRLLDMGVSAEILSGNLNAVLAQRLLRRLCHHCRVAYHAPAEELTLLDLPADSETTLFHAKGCRHCDYQGYRGRFSILEVLTVDSEIDELLLKRAGARVMLSAAQSAGFHSLAEAGVAAVLAGDSSLAELRRVVNLDDRLAGDENVSISRD